MTQGVWALADQDGDCDTYRRDHLSVEARTGWFEEMGVKGVVLTVVTSHAPAGVRDHSMQLSSPAPRWRAVADETITAISIEGVGRSGEPVCGFCSGRGVYSAVKTALATWGQPIAASSS